MKTRDILNKRISFCPNIQTKSYRSITLFEALNSIRTNTYAKQINNIRRLLRNNDIQSYRAKKKQLPAYISLELHPGIDTNLTLVGTHH